MASATQTSNGKKHDQNLQDSAATAALLAVGTPSHAPTNTAAGTGNKLSSASAAMSLKRADPRDLPSYPSAGLANRESSAGAAASLAAANQKSIEHWKPGHLPPANKAAALAKDYRPAELWQPETSIDGSKAAILAHRAGSVKEASRSDASITQQNAASSVIRRSGSKKSAAPPVVDSESHSKALKAATGAMVVRRRSGSLPARTYEYPDSSNSAKNALNAATKASKPANASQLPPDDLPGLSDEDAIRIHNAAMTNLGRDMYSSTPPVKPEIDEKNKQAGLKAAAVSMAKSMYDAQQKVLESYAGHDPESQQAARSSHNRQPSAEVDRREQAMQYLNLQATAQKLAAERLAKLNDESAEYRNYYGQKTPARSRLSLRGRRRSSSDAGLSESSDKVRSERIRSEMSLFNSKLAEVDAQKRQKDRDALIAAAQRNVTKNMQGLDERVFQQTGKASPSMKADWEAKARVKAEAESKSRLQNYGKVDIGGGKYMDQSEVDAIAAARVQPTLDDINEKAAEQRALGEKRRQEAEEQKRIAEEKANEEKERNQKTKQTWRQFKAQEKEEKKAQKQQEQAQKIYEATAAEQDRKAEDFERQKAIEAEREHEEQKKQEWKQFKEEEKHDKKLQKEDEKAKKIEQKKAREEELKSSKDQEGKTKKDEKRKSRRGSLAAVAAVIGIGEKDKEKDKSKLEKKGKSPEPIDLEPQSNEGAAPAKEPNKTIVLSEPDPRSSEVANLPTETPKAGILQAATVGISEPAQVAAEQPTSPSNEGSPKEQGRVSSWFKSKFSRRASRSTKSDDTSVPSEPAKLTKATRSPPKDSRPIELITQLPVDPSKATPGFGTDNIPHIAAAADNDDEDIATESKYENLRGKDVGSSAIAPSSASAAPSEAVTGSAALDNESTTHSYPASAVPDHLQSRADTNNSERDIALAGRQQQQIPIATSTAAAVTDEGAWLRSHDHPPPHQRRSSESSSSISSLSDSDASGEYPAFGASNAHQPLTHSEVHNSKAQDVDISPVDSADREIARQTSATAHTISGSSSQEGQEEFEEARDEFDTQEVLHPPWPRYLEDGGAVRRNSPVRETRFHEELQEGE